MLSLYPPLTFRLEVSAPPLPLLTPSPNCQLLLHCHWGKAGVGKEETRGLDQLSFGWHLHAESQGWLALMGSFVDSFFFFFIYFY